MLFLWLIEFLVTFFIIVEVGIPMIFNLKFFPVLRNLRNRKKLAEIKSDIENVIIDREASQMEEKLIEKEMEVKKLKRTLPITEEIVDVEVDAEVANKQAALYESRRIARRNLKERHKRNED